MIQVNQISQEETEKGLFAPRFPLLAPVQLP
jgi:hypothetical protein